MGEQVDVQDYISIALLVKRHKANVANRRSGVCLKGGVGRLTLPARPDLECFDKDEGAHPLCPPPQREGSTTIRPCKGTTGQSAFAYSERLVAVTVTLKMHQLVVEVMSSVRGLHQRVVVEMEGLKVKGRLDELL
jgi:hypothetical protein